MTRELDHITACFRGDRLYGDDFAGDALKRWYAEEEYGYYQLSVGANPQSGDNAYGYDALNWWYAFRVLAARQFKICVGLGSAKGDDVAPLAPFVERFLIIEPAEKFWRREIGGKPATYVKPSVTGELAIATGAVDLVTSLGVLHHIANVSTVVREIGRIVRPGGLFVFREPIHSMGDWRKPRKGLTRNERGIPSQLMRAYLETAGFDVVHWYYCMFAPFSKLNGIRIVRGFWNYGWLMPIDQLASWTFSWNKTYHRTGVLEKLAPHCVFGIARRR